MSEICPICGSDEVRHVRGTNLSETTHHECGPCGANYATYSDTQDNALRQLRADNNELRARLEAAEPDARRYRWLRDDERGRFLSCAAIVWVSDEDQLRRAQIIDTAVDAAMAGAKEGQ